MKTNTHTPQYRYLKVMAVAVCVIFSFFTTTNTINAQLEIGLREQDVSVSMAPETPKGGELVTISLSSFSINIDSLTIVWKKNGVTEKSGVGLKSIVIESPEIGESHVVTAEIFNRNQSVKKTVTIRPAEIDILWEATDSYVPPFYKGKALPGSEAEVRVVAIPNTTINDNDLIYTWRRNFTAAPSASGYGKQSFTTRLGYLDPTQNIEVRASNVSGSYESGGSVIIAPIQQKVLYYEIHPTLGLLTNKTISNNKTIIGSNFELFVSPFFFSTRDGIDSAELVYDWTIGGKSIPKESAKNRVTLQFNEKESGTTQVRTGIRNTAKIFQQSQSSISITKK